MLVWWVSFEAYFAANFHYFFFRLNFQQDEFCHVKCSYKSSGSTKKIVFTTTTRSNIHGQNDVVRCSPGKVMRKNAWIISSTIFDTHVQFKVVMQCSPGKDVWNIKWIVSTTEFNINVQLKVVMLCSPKMKCERTRG